MARVEGDDVVGEDALEDVLAHVARQHAPGVGLRPRDVDEVVQEDVRPRLADRARRRVEVVVVEHHDDLVLALDLVEHRVGQVLVDDAVALLVGLDLVLADVRRVREVPQVVLDEPQHRVRDHVVERGRRRRGRTRPAGCGTASPRRRTRTTRRRARLLASASSSLIADAIQSASRWLTRPVSAVTRPPPPRVGHELAVRRRARTSPGRGSRRERAGRRRAHPRSLEDPQPVAQEARGQEVLAHVLLARRARAAARARARAGSRSARSAHSSGESTR